MNLYDIEIEEVMCPDKNRGIGLPAYMRVKGLIIKPIKKLRKGEMAVEVFGFCGYTGHIVKKIDDDITYYRIENRGSSYKKEKEYVDFYLTCLLEGMTADDIMMMVEL